MALPDKIKEKLEFIYSFIYLFIYLFFIFIYLFFFFLHFTAHSVLFPHAVYTHLYRHQFILGEYNSSLHELIQRSVHRSSSLFLPLHYDQYHYHHRLNRQQYIKFANLKNRLLHHCLAQEKKAIEGFTVLNFAYTCKQECLLIIAECCRS